MRSSFQILKACTLILVILFTILATEYKHHCNWKDCPHEGQRKFTPRWEYVGYKVNDIGRIQEEYHFYNPGWSEEKCILSAENKYKSHKHYD